MTRLLLIVAMVRMQNPWTGKPRSCSSRQSAGAVPVL